MKHSFKGLSLALLALSCGTALLAQRDLATLVGTVTDPSGGVVVNATITITEGDTGLVYTLTTGSTGEETTGGTSPNGVAHATRLASTRGPAPTVLTRCPSERPSASTNDEIVSAVARHCDAHRVATRPAAARNPAWMAPSVEGWTPSACSSHQS